MVRLMPVSVDLNPEVEKEVFEFMLNEDEEQERQFKQLALLVRFSLSQLTYSSGRVVITTSLPSTQ